MIDRRKLVTNHNPILNNVHPLSPLSVGNGEFAFTADITGLQTFPEAYDVPLGTQSQWGWHSTDGRDHYQLKDLTLTELASYDRQVGYPISATNQEDIYHWLRQNPHRLQLGQISFRLRKENGDAAKLTDLTDIQQELNLWNGILHSRFTLEGEPVEVKTVCHPHVDQLSVHVSSPLIRRGLLDVFIRFPSPHMSSRLWEESVALNWEDTENHETKLIHQEKQMATIERRMDDDGYFVNWLFDHAKFEQTGQHEYTLMPDSSQQEMTFTVGFSQQQQTNQTFDQVYEASETYWEDFWMTGGIIDFSESTDPRAEELERRVILSQFLIDIHSSGSLPPQETGLLYNSWFGKFHLEMHWWHAANLPIWGRGDKLAKSLDWYYNVLPHAKEIAKQQGYEGARWPKQIGDDGKQSPSEIATLLIWQQPHPIFLAELIYRANPSQQILERWKEIVIETANFMVSYAHFDEEGERYVLGPPLIPAQECHRPEDSMNPTFELEYWKQGLEMASNWLNRLGEKVPAKWREVASKIAKPTHQDGVYLAHENCPDTFTKYNIDHPSMVGALGILPGTLIEPEIMKNTLERIYKEWQWDTSWGWDFPMCAMSAARLGEGELAVNFLLMDVTKNRYLPNGHNYQDETLTAYLPGNGGLLTAVAMMVAGWHGHEHEHCPGFPKDGSWKINYENIHPIL